MKYFFTIIYAYLLISVQIFASDFTVCESTEKLFQYFYYHKKIDSSCLILFDIDDTLLVSKKPALRSLALDNLINEVCAELKCSISEALSLIDYSLNQSQDHLGSGELIDPSYVDLFKYLADKNTQILALTKVSVGKVHFKVPKLDINQMVDNSYAERRLQDIQQNGINFNTLLLEELKNKNTKLEKTANCKNEDTSECPVLNKGVILTGSLSKGETIKKLLSFMEWKPANIIFVDNSQLNLESVRDSLSQTGINFEGIHFTYVNNLSKNFPIQEIRYTAQFICSHLKWPT